MPLLRFCGWGTGWFLTFFYGEAIKYFMYLETYIEIYMLQHRGYYNFPEQPTDPSNPHRTPIRSLSITSDPVRFTFM